MNWKRIGAILVMTPGIASELWAQEVVATKQADPVSFSWINWVVLVAYLAGMIGVGIFFSRRESDSRDFFLAGGRIPWWAAGLSIYGTQLSAITFMSVPALALTQGGNWTRLVGSWTILLLAPLIIFFFLPLFRRLNVQTAYEYLEYRFNVIVRWLASLTFISFQVGRMGIVLLLPAAAISAATGVNVLLAIVVMGVLATTYTVLGGIEAVIWTDVVQVVVLIGGAILCLGASIWAVGSPATAWEMAYSADKVTLFDWSTSLDAPTSWVLFIGFFFINLVSYTTDQTVVQRYLTTKDETASARSIWLNAIMVIPTGILFMALGTSLWVFYEVHPELATPESADQIVPWFIVRELPVGVAGLVIAGIFAAAMSSLDSSMNSIASAIVNDFWLRVKGEATPHQELRIARILTLIIGALGTAMALIMGVLNITSLFDYFNLMIGMLGGGLAGIFLLAVFTTRTHWIGAIVGLISGAIATGIVQFDTSIHVYLAGAAGTVTCFIVGYLSSWVIPCTRNDLAGLTIHTMRRPQSQPQEEVACPPSMKVSTR
ncbi:sodium:solute symporter [Bremerella alba]|uniref:Sodium/glucose cotransporter n=1 Tax=Bremerella alba TaxID=980252 RepID=A0A7V8VA31_9BACT|nr:sodium:solute symporter [Bremerella alba]MBA2117660.1 Sodium/glucose cotransporter [Bremerella alba]